LRTRDPPREPVHPGHLSRVDRLVRDDAALGQTHERGATVVRVRGELQEAVADQSIHGGVHALSRQTHAPSDLRHRERPLRQDDGTEHLPARRRQSPVGPQEVPGIQQQAIRAERGQDEFRCGLSGGRPLLPSHGRTLTILSDSCQDVRSLTEWSIYRGYGAVPGFTTPWSY